MLHSYLRGKRADGGYAQVEVNARRSTASLKAGGSVEVLVEVEGMGRITLVVYDSGGHRLYHSREGKPHNQYGEVYSGSLGEVE